MLTMNEFQNQALETAVYPERHCFDGLMYLGLGLAGEAGEVTDHVKKAFRDDGSEVLPARMQEIKKELGDVLWYVAVIAEELGFTLEDVARTNTAKLMDRKRRGMLGGSGDNR